MQFVGNPLCLSAITGPEGRDGANGTHLNTPKASRR
jgi:hypothetical protein